MIASWTGRAESARTAACLQNAEILLTGNDFSPFSRIKKAGVSPLQLVDISKLGSNSKTKKFSYSFIFGKGYSPPAGENSFFVYSLSGHQPAFFVHAVFN